MPSAPKIITTVPTLPTRAEDCNKGDCGRILVVGGSLGMAGAPCLAARASILTDPPPVTVVIATRERPAQLANCLASLERVDYPNFDVLVVDNDPESDETRHLVEAIGRRYPVRYLRERRRGRAKEADVSVFHLRDIMLVVDIDGGQLVSANDLV